MTVTIDWEKVVDTFSTLDHDWDSYGSAPIDQRAITQARAILASVPHGPYNVVPINGGGVMIEWRFGERDLEVWIDPDEPLSYLLVVGADADARYYEGAIDQHDIPAFITGEPPL